MTMSFTGETIGFLRRKRNFKLPYFYQIKLEARTWVEHTEQGKTNHFQKECMEIADSASQEIFSALLFCFSKYLH